jgi:phosphoribosylanthranilate isomerase
MKRIIVQLYEIQDPHEAEKLIGLGVDRIGSVILTPENWKVPAVRDVVRLVRGSGSRSSLIPLMERQDDILRCLDYYQPDIAHFCELIPLSPRDRQKRETACEALDAIQRRVRREFPEMGITRSIPLPAPGPADAAAIREAIVAIAGTLAAASDGFMTDTLRGLGRPEEEQPVAGYVGITGEICDWDLAGTLVAESLRPVILAGGIGPDNVFDALLRVKPAGIDSCTRTNALDNRGRPIRFKKDMDRVRRLLDEVRRAEEHLPAGTP